MSLRNLNNDDLFDYLMNLEHYNELSPDELHYLISKWKYFYRVVQGKYTIIKNDYDYITKIEIKKENIHKIEIEKYKHELRKVNNILESLQSRKLTWKERILGKIKIK